MKRTRTRGGAPAERSRSCSLVVRDLAQLKALTDPLRLRILRGFAEGPTTAKKVAARIGEKPGRLYHHVSVLESVGLLEPTHTRQVRGTVEKYYRAVASEFEVDGALLSAQPPSPGSDAERARAAGSLLAQARAELLASSGRAGGGPGTVPRPFVARAVIQATPQRIKRLLERLRSELEGCDAGTSATAPDAVGYALTLAGYPVEAEPSAARVDPVGGEQSPGTSAPRRRSARRPRR